jgi:hypothetical protein
MDVDGVATYLAERADGSTPAAVVDSGEDEGCDTAFEFLCTVPDSVVAGCWHGECFVYTTSGGRLNYAVAGQVATVAHLQGAATLLGYVAQRSRVILLSGKDMGVVSYALPAAVLDYKTAVTRGDTEAAAALVAGDGDDPNTVAKADRPRVARFLEAMGRDEDALMVSTDPEHKLSGRHLFGFLFLKKNSRKLTTVQPTNSDPSSPPISNPLSPSQV